MSFRDISGYIERIKEALPKEILEKEDKHPIKADMTIEEMLDDIESLAESLDNDLDDANSKVEELEEKNQELQEEIDNAE